ncbi:MAG TPA: hypothetical protein VMR21_02655 [Vicinamibacteria bacterium]|nr:hypothetical protein [Vicinamibacteria bacterium]
MPTRKRTASPDRSAAAARKKGTGARRAAPARGARRPDDGDALASLRDEMAAVSQAVASQSEAIDRVWTESLLRLPRPEDYEPLAGPLREFARVAPALVETLAAVVKAVTPLPALVQQALRTRGPAVPQEPEGPNGLRASLGEAASRMAAARTAIREGLASLPRERAYATAATQLRELATVSPSLMEWLRLLPSVTVPLGDAIASLDEAARELEDAERAARRALAAED